VEEVEEEASLEIMDLRLLRRGMSSGSAEERKDGVHRSLPPELCSTAQPLFSFLFIGSFSVVH
jgi:hypothetical protein